MSTELTLALAAWAAVVSFMMYILIWVLHKMNGKVRK